MRAALTLATLLTATLLTACGQQESPRSKSAAEEALPPPAEAPADGVAAGAGADQVGGDAKS